MLHALLPVLLPVTVTLSVSSVTSGAPALPASSVDTPVVVVAQAKPKKDKKAEEEAKKAEEEAKKKAADEAAAKAADEARAKADAEAKAKADEAARAADEQKALEAQAQAARGLQARVRVLSDTVALALKRLPGDHRDQRFAVVPFEEAGPEAQQRRLGLVVSDLVVTDLARDHALPLVERAALGKILDEQALGQSGALADGQAAQLGKLAGARALVIGQVSDTGEQFHVTVRAVDAEAATVVTTAEADLPKDELVSYSANAVVLRSKGGAMFRSVVVPGWGQSYNGEDVKAVVFGATTGALALSTLTAAGVYLVTGFVVYPQVGFRDEDKTKSSSALAAEVRNTRETANAFGIGAGVLAAGTAVAWASGALDAYLSGTDVENLDAALAN